MEYNYLDNELNGMVTEFEYFDEQREDEMGDTYDYDSDGSYVLFLFKSYYHRYVAMVANFNRVFKLEIGRPMCIICYTKPCWKMDVDTHDDMSCEQCGFKDICLDCNLKCTKCPHCRYEWIST